MKIYSPSSFCIPDWVIHSLWPADVFQRNWEKELLCLSIIFPKGILMGFKQFEVRMSTHAKSVFSKLQFSPDILANSSRMSPICLILSVFNSPNVVVSSANPSTFSVSLLDSWRNLEFSNLLKPGGSKFHFGTWKCWKTDLNFGSHSRRNSIIWLAILYWHGDRFSPCGWLVCGFKIKWLTVATII